MFKEFYAVYPRKVGKLDAEKAWNQMTAHYDKNAILEGAKKFARLCISEGKEKQFIPYPASWLRAGRWMDEEHETIKPVPLFRPARTVDEAKQYLRSLGKPLSSEIERARSLEDLPAFAKMIPTSWNVVIPLRKEG